MAHFRSWETLENILSSVFLITVLAENIPMAFLKDTGLKKHSVELLKMQTKLLCLRVVARFQEGWNRTFQRWIFLRTII